jgi:hypothetical protein
LLAVHELTADPLQGQSVGSRIESQDQRGYSGVSEQFDYDLVIIGVGISILFGIRKNY